MRQGPTQAGVLFFFVDVRDPKPQEAADQVLQKWRASARKIDWNAPQSEAGLMGVATNARSW
jgi:hypothetical protein